MSSNISREQVLSQLSVQQLQDLLQQKVRNVEGQIPTYLNLRKNWPFLILVILVLYGGYYLWTSDYMAAAVAEVICGLMIVNYLYVIMNTEQTIKIPMYDCPDFYYKKSTNDATTCVHIRDETREFPIIADETDCEKCTRSAEAGIPWQACDINKPCL